MTWQIDQEGNVFYDGNLVSKIGVEERWGEEHFYCQSILVYGQETTTEETSLGPKETSYRTQMKYISMGLRSESVRFESMEEYEAFTPPS